MAPEPTSVTCCVVGCGPAGAMLALLLARSGVEVLVLEKHGDFLRDFRGDTVHPSTQRLLAELGLETEFQRLPQHPSPTLRVVTDHGTFRLADFRRLPGAYPPLTFVPQWDLLDMLVDQAAASPAFRLRMHAEVVDVVRRGGRVVGVRYLDRRDSRGDEAGGEHTVLADLVVAADGRDSAVRRAARLPSVDFGSPFDVLWFRVSRRQDDGTSSFGRISRGRLLALIDRGDYWQIAFVIPKGEADRMRAAGVDAFRRTVAGLVPFLSERVGEIRDWEDVRLLSVQVNRLRRWWRPGLLCIGDAAHAMSPMGGVGINLAIQDAVAAARLLAEPLRQRRVTSGHLARVQLRRMLPTVVTQAFQRVAQRRFVAPLLAGSRVPTRPALVLRLLARVPALQVVPAYLIGIGIRPEHAPRDLRVATGPGTAGVSAGHLGQQQRAGETDGGRQRDERPAVLERLRHHRVRQHRQDAAGGQRQQRTHPLR